MRLHHLEITGFGPFNDPVHIDFDALSEAGLFLLSGPTGAGKSSVLDAVCFALYGDVPGDRAVAKRLRSDHADDDVAPRVVLDATLSGRRFRIDRSPSWTRPKKRGTGVTTEQARVVISERRTAADGTEAWHPLSTRLDETGHLVTRLVGMTLPQFCQVALLPQGRFQAFLRARSDERHALLQQVFQTGRFDRVERWLRDRRVELRRASQSHEKAVADLVSRVSEVGVGQAPDEWAVDPDVLLPWARGLVRTTLDAAAEARTRVEEASTAEARAAEASAAGIELAGLRTTRAAAQHEAHALDSVTSEHETRLRRAEEAQRAVAVRPLHQLAVEARAAEDDLDRQSRAAHRALAQLLDRPDLDDLQVADQQRAASRTLTELARVRPLVSEMTDLEQEFDRLSGTRDRTRLDLRRVNERAVEIPAALDALSPRLAAAREAQTLARALTDQVAAVGSRIRAAESAEVLGPQLDAAVRAHSEAMQSRLDARETLVEIRERRLDGMAAEIAGKLAVGACCPVCGSAEHPSLASPAPGAPDESAEREARRVVDDLEAIVEAHAQQVRGLEASRAAALAEAGDSLGDLRAEAACLTSRLALARQEAETVDALASDIDALRAEEVALARERDAVAAAAARLDTDTAVIASRVASLDDQVDAVVPPGCDIDSLIAHQQLVEERAARCGEARAELGRARAAARRAEDAAAAAAAEAGFDSAEQAAAAWLPPDDVTALLARTQHHEREVERVHALLADPALTEAAAAEPPDLEGLALEHHRAQEAAALARQRESSLRARAIRLRGLADDVEHALAGWTPVRCDLDLVGDLAALVEGKHPDNRLQMRLSAYVLAHRLGQVVEAANLRLTSMSDQRYSLVHTGRRGAGETRGGLSLLVRDDWTGDSRDPATLSGGETFVVSLALALGLADVITDEAGGTDLETLFVDEGFGSLDADTLEDVMDTLDTLRDGGRVVGVVSHVPELQTRIPTQLRVHRGRHGSRTTLRLA